MSNFMKPNVSKFIKNPCIGEIFTDNEVVIRISVTGLLITMGCLG